MLEYFVHLDVNDPPPDLVLATADVPDNVSRKRIDASRLPTGWRATPPPPALVRLGDDFVERSEHCILLVPSAIAPRENNWLVNPQHPDFKKITGRDIEPLNHDPRMFRRGRHTPD
jgi:RES domain-containing protein